MAEEYNKVLLTVKQKLQLPKEFEKGESAA
jgi:hypothetical protein